VAGEIAMTVRTVKRRGERRLVIDIQYGKSDGTKGRFRRDAEVQTLAAAHAEERRRLAALALTGSPLGEVGVAAATTASGTGTAKPKSPGFAEVAKQYLETFAPSHLKPSTIHGYRAVIESFLVPRIGARRLDTVDATTVRELDAELVADGAKLRTRRNVQIVLRSIVRRFAVESGMLAGAPALPALPRSGAMMPATPSAEELEKILDAACETHRVAFLLAAFAGLRAGEIRGLRWEDVDLHAGRLVVRRTVWKGVEVPPKSGNERVVPLRPEIREELEKVPKADRKGFVSRNGWGEAWSHGGLRQAFVRTCERVGVRRWRFHDLRHFFVTELFRAGVAAPTVQALAGHAELATTQRYAHVVRSDLEDAIRRLVVTKPRDRGNSVETGRESR